MGEKLKLGIIGMSEGNGHPYSWAAIFNGYDTEKMKSCPFPVIPAYLLKQNYPSDFLSHRASVTHIWTQSRDVSEHISACSNIPFICDDLEDMIGRVDAVLLARDDAENHAKFALPVIKAGFPIYIDKPFGLRIKDAERLWDACQIDDQIFTCSALQFAKEFDQSRLDQEIIGTPQVVWGTIPKSWNKYAVHLIEPVLKMFPERGNLISVESLKGKDESVKLVQVTWSSGLTAFFQTCGSLPAPLWIRVLGDKGYQDFSFTDSYTAFKAALNYFLDVCQKIKPNVPKDFTREMVQILEEGNHA